MLGLIGVRLQGTSAVHGHLLTQGQVAAERFYAPACSDVAGDVAGGLK